MPVGNKPDGVTAAPALPAGLRAIVVPGRAAPVALPIPVKRAKKPAPAKRGGGLLYLVLAAGLALAASAAVVNHTWPKLWAFAPAPPPAVANKPDPAMLHKSGHIIIPRANSQLCDRYLFDNVSGQMKQAETSPCSAASKKPELNVADQVNSFHSSWRGSRDGAQRPEGSGAPRDPSAPRDGTPAKK